MSNGGSGDGAGCVFIFVILVICSYIKAVGEVGFEPIGLIIPIALISIAVMVARGFFGE
jgi:hypothetical protein